MQTLLSFHGKQEIKDYYVARVQAHYMADEIIQGVYWQEGKGCAVGCTIHGDDHGDYEGVLGIPRILARLEDRLFEGMTNSDAKEFPLAFIQAVPVGVDLTPVWKNFLVWMLVDPETGVIKHANNDEGKKAISDVAALIKRSLLEEITPDQYSEVRAAADAAAYAADAAAYAADAAAYAADAAAYAADAAAYAADAAAYAAYAADAADAAAAYAAAAAAKKNRYKQMADKLIELLKEAQ